MPLFQYETEDGQIIEKFVSIEERDKQVGLKRILKFTGLVWSPTSNGGHK